MGGDVREGKVTLPLIIALQRCTQEERRLVQTVLRDGNYTAVSVEAIRAMVKKYRGIEDTRERALKYTDTAVAQLGPLPESDYKRALHAVTDWVVDRDR